MEVLSPLDKIVYSQLRDLGLKVQSAAALNPQATIIGLTKWDPDGLTCVLPQRPGQLAFYKADIPCAGVAIADLKRGYLPDSGYADNHVCMHIFDRVKFMEVAFEHTNVEGVLEYNSEIMDPVHYLTWCVHGAFNNTGGLTHLQFADFYK